MKVFQILKHHAAIRIFETIAAREPSLYMGLQEISEAPRASERSILVKASEFDYCFNS